MKRNSREARMAFVKTFNSPNFVTPKIVDAIETEKYYVELSTGEGIDRKQLYGVTVITKDLQRTDLSRCFFSQEAAEKYIAELDNLKEV